MLYIQILQILLIPCEHFKSASFLRLGYMTAN